MTAISNSLYQTLVHAGAPVGTLESTSRTLRGANGTPTGIVVGRTLVDHLHGVFRFWFQFQPKSCYGQTGMAQISATQSITEPFSRASCSGDSLPTHLQKLLDQTSRDLDTTHKCHLNDVLGRYWCPVQRLPVTHMWWSMKLIPDTAHIYTVHLAGCLLRRSRKKRNVSLTCWPVDKLNLVTVHGRHQSS